jgi:hypothetical protein
MSTAKNNRRIFLAIGVIILSGVAVVGVVTYDLWKAVVGITDALSTETTVAIQPKANKNPVELDLTYGKDVTNVALVVVTDAEGNELWRLRGGGQEKPATIVYGVVPTDAHKTWKQEFPEDGKPPADIRGKQVKVDINVGYNIAFGPGHNSTVVEINVPKE